MRNFMFSIAVAVMMLPTQTIAPITTVNTNRTNQKYENYFTSKQKSDVLREVYEITEDSSFVSKLSNADVLNDYSNLVKINEIASELGVRASWLLMVFYIETAGTFSTEIENDLTNAVGIIQWLPSTAMWLNTSTESLKKMSFIEQLDLVKLYITRLGMVNKINSYENMYLSVFHPAAVNAEDSYIIGIKPKHDSLMLDLKIPYRKRIKYIRYTKNSGMDRNKDGILTVKDVKMFAKSFS